MPIEQQLVDRIDVVNEVAMALVNDKRAQHHLPPCGILDIHDDDLATYQRMANVALAAIKRIREGE